MVGWSCFGGTCQTGGHKVLTHLCRYHVSQKKKLIIFFKYCLTLKKKERKQEIQHRGVWCSLWEEQTHRQTHFSESCYTTRSTVTNTAKRHTSDHMPEAQICPYYYTDILKDTKLFKLAYILYQVTHIIWETHIQP